MESDGVGFGDLVQHAQQLTADMDVSGGLELPRVERNLTQIRDMALRMASHRGPTLAVQENSDVKASLLLGSQGYDMQKASQKLEGLSSAKTFEPLEPVRDTDIQGFLKNERENALLAVMEQTRKATSEECEQRHWENLEGEWERKKQRTLNALIGSVQDELDFPPENEGLLSDSISLQGRSTLDNNEMAYSRQVYIYNEEIIQGAGIRPDLIKLFSEAAEKMDDPSIIELWDMVRLMTDIPQAVGTSIHKSRASTKVQMALVQQALTFLEESLSLKLQGDGLTIAAALQAIEVMHLSMISMEQVNGTNLQAFLTALHGDSYKDVQLQGISDEATEQFNSYTKCVQTRIYSNLQQAQLGGIPGTFNLVRSFLNVHLPTMPPVEFEGCRVENQPVWAMIYYCMRCGDRQAALQAVHAAQHQLGDFVKLFDEYCSSSDRRLSVTSEREISLQYRRSVRNSPDPYKKAVYCILGRCDPHDNQSEVATSTEDYLWVKLNQVCYEETDNAAQDRLSFTQFQKTLLEEYGESHFNAYQQPLLFFRVLFLTGQFEAAIHFLNRLERLRCHAVHIAIVLYEEQMLLRPYSIQAQLLSRETSDADPLRRLNFARLIMMYTRKFGMTDPREALQYFFFLRELKAVQGENLFMSCVSELVLETREFDTLLGQLNKDGSRRPGAIDKFRLDTSRIIEMVAKDTEDKGLNEEAVRLYDLAKSYDKVLELLNKLLSEVLSQPPAPQSNKDRRKQLAISIAERYKQLGVEGSAITTSTFHLLLDLCTFFDLFHSSKLEQAYNVLTELGLLPFTSEAVEAKVQSFQNYSHEIRQNLPDILHTTMTILYRQYQSARSSGVQSPLAGSSLSSPAHLDTNKRNYVSYLRTQARAIITFAGMIQYRMPGDTNARLVQLEALMN